MKWKLRRCRCRNHLIFVLSIMHVCVCVCILYIYWVAIAECNFVIISDHTFGFLTPANYANTQRETHTYTYVHMYESGQEESQIWLVCCHIIE